LTKQNFESFAAAEADVQTRDFVKAIKSGQILIPPFNDTEAALVLLDMPIHIPEELQKGKINSPIMPDAIIICGDDWLIVECKHKFTNAYLKVFDDKCNIIENNMDKVWIHQNIYPIPKRIHRVACSITNFSAVDSNTSNITKVVRVGQAYEIVNK